MKRFAKVAAAALGVLAVSAILAASGSRQAIAQAIHQVTVENGAGNPVPVAAAQSGGWSVNISNPVVAVRDLTNPAVHPLRVRGFVSLNGVAGGSTTFGEDPSRGGAPLVVPPGKRLILDAVYTIAAVPPGSTPVAFIDGPFPYLIELPCQPTPGGSGDQARFVCNATQLGFPFEAGESLDGRVQTTVIGNGDSFGNMILIGHYIDI